MASKSFGKSVKVEKPLLVIIRGVKSKGLVVNKFEEDIPGDQIRFHVPEGRVEEIQKAYSALNPKKPSPFFGDDEKWMTGKCEEVKMFFHPASSRNSRDMCGWILNLKFQACL